MNGALVENDFAVDALRHAIADGEHGLALTPKAVRHVVETGAWRRRVIVKTGEPVEFDSFRLFVTTPPLEGLGSSVDVLRMLCREDKAVLDLLDEPLAEHGANQYTTDGDANGNSKGGNTEDYTRRRLRRDRPDLYQRVLGGQLSANRAAQEAGFRPVTATIRVDSAQAAVRGLLRRFDVGEIRAALDELEP